jgi:cytochrome c-type biogenesis protein CcmH
VLLGVVVVGLLAVGATRESGPSTPEERVEAISRRLACPICDGESVFESRNNASAAIRAEIQSQVTAGLRSDEEIISFIEQRYTASVLLVPRATGLDAVVWALPVAAFVCAVAGLVVAFRRWKRAADTVPTDADRRLVDEALRRDDDI